MVQTFTGANLYKACLAGSCLKESRILFCNFELADLQEADLSDTDATDATFMYSNLERATLNNGDFSFADFYKVNFSYANLSEANLKGAKLFESDLTEANFKDVNLSAANLRGAYLNKTVLTGVKLFDISTTGWILKDIICEYAFWDKEGEKKTYYEPGEFEKLHRSHTTVEIHFQNGMDPLEIITLPALVNFINKDYPGYTFFHF